ncbi:MAG TPA: asparaginase [Candidatus Woesearchaeota archaeon]|nr:asparaginase [Candidatus Woesearchaeota archaeon]
MYGKKKSVLILKTGGTIAMEKNSLGVLAPTSNGFIDKIPGIGDIAKIDTIDLMNIDSTNMTTEYRTKIASEIYKKYFHYDGFVITHGTDTMVDTAAALNYMLQDIGKPIVLTGSQIPISAGASSDAMRNIYLAVKTATSDFREVVISFGNYVLRGNRAIKKSEWEFDAFDTPRAGYLAEAGIEFILSDSRIPRNKKTPKLYANFDSKVNYISQTSGGQNSPIKYYADNPRDISGLVIEGYGAGNIQTHLLPSLQRMTKMGKIIVVTTNCLNGRADLNLYEVGDLAMKSGILSGKDMTSHTAVQKLMWALGISKNITDKYHKIQKVKELFYKPIGRDIELSYSLR